MTIDDIGKRARLLLPGGELRACITAYMKDEDGVEQWLLRYIDMQGVVQREWFRESEIQLVEAE